MEDNKFKLYPLNVLLAIEGVPSDEVIHAFFKCYNLAKEENITLDPNKPLSKEIIKYIEGYHKLVEILDAS